MKIVFKEYIGGKITMKKKRKSEADNKTFRIARDKMKMKREEKVK